MAIKIYETNCCAISADKLKVFSEGTSIIIRLNRNSSSEINVKLNAEQTNQLIKTLLGRTKAGNVLYGK